MILTKACSLISCLAFLLLAAPELSGEEQIAQEKLVKHQAAFFEQLGVGSAWKSSKGSPDFQIGVIDNGFDFFHPDLAEQLIPGYYFPGGYERAS